MNYIDLNPYNNYKIKKFLEDILNNLQVNLSSIDLTSIDFSTIDLSSINLSSINLSCIKIRDNTNDLCLSIANVFIVTIIILYL